MSVVYSFNFDKRSNRIQSLQENSSRFVVYIAVYLNVIQEIIFTYTAGSKVTYVQEDEFIRNIH